MSTRVDTTSWHRWKIPVAIAAIVGALGLALWQRSAPTSASSPVEAATPPTASIFEQIPAPTGTTASEVSVAKSLALAHKKPNDAHAWATVGDALAQRLRDTTENRYYDLAGKAYTHALSLDPANIAAMNGMAWVTGGAHEFDKSIDWANKSIAANPSNADAFGILGDANLELGNYDEAFDNYQEMIDLRPDLSSWSRGAYLLWINGDTFRSANLMQQAIRAGGAFAENTAWCRAKLATMDFHQGAFPAAAGVLAPSLKEKSRNPHVLLAAAQIAEATGEVDLAVQYYELLLAHVPNHDALVGLGDLHAVKGEMAEAEKYYQQVEALHTSGQATGLHDHTRMALFLADHDRNIVEAMRLAEQHKLTHNVFEADALAWVYYKNGENKKALKAINLALSRNTPDSAMHYHAGMIQLRAGDTVTARNHLQTALALNPKFSVLQAPLAAKALEGLTTHHQASTASNPVEK